jgi:hypothetical protein
VVILLLKLPGHWFVRLNWRTVFDLLSSQVHEKEGAGLIQVAESIRSDQHLAVR